MLFSTVAFSAVMKLIESKLISQLVILVLLSLELEKLRVGIVKFQVLLLLKSVKFKLGVVEFEKLIVVLRVHSGIETLLIGVETDEVDIDEYSEVGVGNPVFKIKLQSKLLKLQSKDSNCSLFQVAHDGRDD